MKIESIIDGRSTTLGGYVIVVAFLMLFFLWGGTISLSSAAIAPGTVGVVGNKKSIQHLDGGIVRQIHVTDGDRVSTGDALLSLFDEEDRARYEELEKQRVHAAVELARWKSERDDIQDIVLPDWLARRSADPLVSESLNSQVNILDARRRRFESTRDALKHERDELAEEHRAARFLVGKLKVKLRLMSDELVEYRRLEKQGLVTRAQVYELMQEHTDVDLEIDLSRSRMELTTQRQGQIESRIRELDAGRQAECSEQAALARERLSVLRQQLVSAREALTRKTIVSPIDGLVVGLQFNTIGGVVAPGQLILEIVPDNEALLIVSRVDPKDRNAVVEGQSAEVRFSAFDRRSNRPVAGIVKLISADRMIDQNTQAPYYQTLVELAENPADVLEGGDIYPGMQADVLIVTGDQTLLQYLLSPITRSFDRALTEN